jgi:hypothetical protein
MCISKLLMTHTVHSGIGCQTIEKVAMMENAKCNSREFYFMAMRKCSALNAICHDNVAEELDAQDQEKKVWKDYGGDDVR